MLKKVKIDKLKIAQDKIDDLARQLEVKDLEVKLLRKERDDCMDPLIKNRIKANISRLVEEMIQLTDTAEELERQLESGNFPRQLFNYLIDFDFGRQRETYVEYLQKADDDKIGAFLIHSEGDYKQITEHFWFWQCVLPSYLNNPLALKRFFKPNTSDIRSLFTDFKASITNIAFDYSDPIENKIDLFEIEKLVPVLEETLKRKDVVIYIYLSTSFLKYDLIYDFLEQIWKPICDELSVNNQRENWLKLFIIDNECIDRDGKDYHVTDIEDSITLRKPFKLEKCGIQPDDFFKWLENGKTHSGKIFYQYLSECTSFLNCFCEEKHYQNYIPECKTVEKLLDNVCKDLPNNLINHNLVDLANEYQKIKIQG